jgi:hypothetical protein
MKITKINNKRELLKDDGKIVNISDGYIIQYQGIYYKKINEIIDFAEIKTMFIGVIECDRYRYDTGITGIYIKPLYIWNNMQYRWNKIINYKEPKFKYFLYPHLLMLPDTYYNYKPLYFMETCENKDLNEFNNTQSIEGEFDLQIIYEEID